MNNAETKTNKVEYMDIYEIKRRHSGHWFDPGSMRFFNSRLPQGGYKVGNKVYFISSEHFRGLYEPDGERLYTIRVMDYNTGDVDTVGEFNKLTKAQAKTKLNKIIKADTAS